MNKKEILEFMRANRDAHLATIENGQPRVRAIGIYRMEEDGIIIQTFKSKDVGKQLMQNPNVEICFNNFEDRIQVRVRGAVELMEDDAAVEECLKERPFLKQFVDKGEEIALFCLKGGLAHVWTLEKNFAPKEFIKL
ncbi:MAG: pyridoxamine 5'-phosphate oxidase family protein [Bacillota bacterium]|nr:pyridoxamine 5'-phosphate oxidase family protein [Bacillota bacterium]